MLNFKRSILTIAVASALTACGGGGGGGGGGGTSTSTPAPTSGSTVSGTAVKGIIRNGVVKAYAVTNGSVDRSRELATATTDSNGKYSLVLPTDYEGPVKVEISAVADTVMVCDIAAGCGTTAFGATLSLESDFNMGAVIANAKPNTTISTPITPLTHMAAGLAEKAGINADKVHESNTQVANLFNLDTITDYELIDVTDPDKLAAASPEAQKASLLAAALMEAALSTTGDDDFSDSLDKLTNDFVANDGQFVQKDTDVQEIISLEDILSAEASIIAKAKQHAAENGKTVNVTSIESELNLLIAELPEQADDETKTNVKVAPDLNIENMSKARALVSDIRDLAYSTGAASSDSSKVVSSVENFTNQISLVEGTIGADSEPVVKALKIAVQALGIATEADTLNAINLIDVENESIVVHAKDNGNQTMTLSVSNENIDGVTVNLSTVIHANITGDDSSSDVDVGLNITGSAASSAASMTIKDGSKVNLAYKESVTSNSTGPNIEDIDRINFSNVDMDLILELAQKGVSNPVHFTGELDIDVSNLNLTAYEEYGPTANQSRFSNSADDISLTLKGTFADNSNTLSATFTIAASGAQTGVTNWTNWPYEGSTSFKDNVDRTASLKFVASLTGLSNEASVTITTSTADAGETVTGELAVAWQSRQLEISENGDNFVVTSKNGARLELNDPENTKLNGGIFVGTKKYATVSELDNGIVKVSYIDNTFESLQ
ncbi:hypothetical protein [Marinobacterium jannaschii]|uniref:hypothetical protein n=1 Tax=Marinobacterium jannaschii TaxID=64970 RepID=UPI0012EC6B29|nr:hypothetical protein [Marinobacterium jannaschii]